MPKLLWQRNHILNFAVVLDRRSGSRLLACCSGKSFCFLTALNIHLLSRFCYFVFLLADFPYFCLQEVNSSQAMEKEAFIRCINNIHHSQNLPMTMLSTDQYVSIKRLKKTDERFKYIEHQFDPWHVARGILKKFMQSAATKGTHYISAPNRFYAWWWQKAIYAKKNL